RAGRLRDRKQARPEPSVRGGRDRFGAVAAIESRSGPRNSRGATEGASERFVSALPEGGDLVAEGRGPRLARIQLGRGGSFRGSAAEAGLCPGARCAGKF